MNREEARSSDDTVLLCSQLSYFPEKLEGCPSLSRGWGADSEPTESTRMSDLNSQKLETSTPGAPFCLPQNRHPFTHSYTYIHTYIESK